MKEYSWRFSVSWRETLTLARDSHSAESARPMKELIVVYYAMKNKPTKLSLI